MPRLIHLAPETASKRIRRNGIAPRRIKHKVEGFDRLVWVFPQLPSYTLSHQWLRELKRSGARTLVAVDLDIAGDELVLVGHFGRLPQRMTADEAVALIRGQADPRGYEMLIPRRVEPAEIVRLRTLAQGIGWRYWPEAKAADRRPCDCPACVPRGEIMGQRYRARIGELRRRWEAKRTSRGETS
jgi:hypothetical protein